jgi:CHAT domain/SIR2-like domain
VNRITSFTRNSPIHMPSSNYIECLLRITSHNHATLEFQGQIYPGKPRLDPASLQTTLLKSEIDTKQYGIDLFRALFPPGDDLLSGYRLALSNARSTNSRLRFRLQIDNTAPADLFAINWERLHDEKERQTLSRWPQTSFSRFIGLPQQLPAPIVGKPKLLVVISSPTDYAATRLDRIDRTKVRQELVEALQPLLRFAEYEFLEAPATLSNIRERLKDGFNALHIQAHALLPPERDMAWMYLEKENGEADPINEDFFRETFSGLDDLRLVVLMACQSGAQTREDPFGGLAQTLVQQNLPIVVAMQQPIEFDAAKIFNKYFYRELARHGEADAAINEARLHLRLDFSQESREWSAPVLFMRLKDSPVWEPTAPVEVHEAQPEPKVATEEDSFWVPIIEALRQGQLVPIIGPNINQGLLPSNKEITGKWTKKYEYHKYNYPVNNRNDLPRVARFVETNYGRKFPHRALQTLYIDDLLEREKAETRFKLKDKSLPEVISAVSKHYFDGDADAPHRILAELENISTYVTTTSDNFMAEALKYRGRAVRREVLLWNDDATEPADYQSLTGKPESPVVWHIYGSPPKANSLVLTEDDYLDFLRNVSREPWRRPANLMSTLTESLLLFLGFNVRDLDFRILFKALISHLKVGTDRVAILQIEPEESYKERELEFRLVQTFLEKDSSEFQVKIRWLSVRDFLLQLRDKL